MKYDYTVHYVCTNNYNLTVEASNEDDAMKIANELIEDDPDKYQTGDEEWTDEINVVDLD